MKIKEKTADAFLFFILFTLNLFLFHMLYENVSRVIAYIVLIIFTTCSLFLKDYLLNTFHKYIIPKPNNKMKVGPDT